MEINYRKIGKQIQNWRLRRECSQEELAALTDREPAYLSRIENGRQKPSLDTLLRISKALNLDINNLLTDVPEPQSPSQTKELEYLLDGCTEEESRVLLLTMEALKRILKSTRRGR